MTLEGREHLLADEPKWDEDRKDGEGESEDPDPPVFHEDAKEYNLS